MQSVRAQSSNRPDGMRFVPNIYQQFTHLTERPEALALHKTNTPDPTQCHHYQGMNRVDGPDGTPFFYLTRSGNLPSFAGAGLVCADTDIIHAPNGHLVVFRMDSRDKDGERLRSNRLRRGVHMDDTEPPAEDRATTFFTFVGGDPNDPNPSRRPGLVPGNGAGGILQRVYQHPGGMQAVGHMLAVAMDMPRQPIRDSVTGIILQPYESAPVTSQVLLLDVSNPENPIVTSQFVPRNLQGVVLRDADGIGITPLPSGRYLMSITSGLEDEAIFFYRSSVDGSGTPHSLSSPALTWQFVNTTPGPDVQDAAQCLQLLREGSIDGKLYLAGSRGFTLFSDRDRIDLYRVECASPNFEPMSTITLVRESPGQRITPFPSTGGAELADLAAAAGFHVTPSGELLFYASTHDNIGPGGTIPFGEWRHINMMRDNSPLMQPSATRCRPMKPWIQLFDAKNYGDSGAAGDGFSAYYPVIDYADRNLDDFDNFSILELQLQFPQGTLFSHNDKAQSWKWWAPVGCSIQVLDYRNGQVDEVRTLVGDGLVHSDPDLSLVLNDNGDLDMTKEIDAVRFLENCDAFYSVPVPVVTATHTNQRRTSCDIRVDLAAGNATATGRLLYGLTRNFGLTAPLDFGPSCLASAVRNVPLSSLTPGTTYYYSAEVTTEGGTTRSITTAFATASPVLAVDQGSNTLPETDALPHGTTLTFGTTTWGTGVNQPIRLRNTGNGKLWVDGLLPSPGYSIVPLGPFGGTALNAFTAAGGLEQGDVIGFNLRLTATALGTYNGTFVIRSDDPFHTDYTINLTGTVSPAPQAIAWNPITVISRLCSVPLNGTGGGSGNPVTYLVIGGPGRIAGGVLTATGTGSVVVRASQAGNANYLAATPLDMTITFENPSYSLYLGSTAGPDLASGTVSADFGATFQTVPVFRSLSLVNKSDCAITVTGISVPAGFDVPGFSGVLSISAGGTGVLSVRLLASVRGLQSGQLRLTTDFGPVTCPVIGDVCAPVNTSLQDPGFDEDGMVLAETQPGLGNDDELRAVAVLPDGRIVAAGFAASGVFNVDFLVVCRLASGAPDLSFGKGGYATVDFGGTDEAYAVAVQSDGKIVVAGTTGLDFALVRLTASGALDTTFSGDGKATLNFDGGTDIAYGVALTADGRIVVAGSAGGTTGFPPSTHFAAARFHANGSLDSSFGGGGWVKTAVSATRSDAASCVLVLPDGKVLAGGNVSFGAADNRPAFVLWNAAGIPDSAFGAGNGISVISNQSVNYTITSMTRQATSGLVVAAGSLYTTFSSQRLMRLTADGFADPAFGGTVVPLNGEEMANAVIGAPDGSLYTAGYAKQQDNRIQLTVSQFTEKGLLRTGFGSSGRLTVTPMATRNSLASGLAVDAQCRILAVGNTQSTAFNDSDYVLVRLGQPSSALETWRMVHFDGSANSDAGADLADGDGDGLPNLAEFAMGLDPLHPDAQLQPKWHTGADGALSISIPDFPGASTLAEMSTTMAAGSWTPVPDAGAAGQHLFRVLPVAPQIFLRLWFSNP
ncbi:MAG: hypothetical protein RIS76_4255 [Verrucomicrobiota bacterium]